MFQVTHAVRTSLDWVDRNHTFVLSILLVMFLVHLFFSLMLMIATKCDKRTLLIPWMVSHMISSLIMITTFTFWTFMSFFIDLLVAIIFPVIGGLVLGLWIVMWRQVYHFFAILRARDRHLFISIKMQEETKNNFSFTWSTSSVIQMFNQTGSPERHSINKVSEKLQRDLKSGIFVNCFSILVFIF